MSVGLGWLPGEHVSPGCALGLSRAQSLQGPLSRGFQSLTGTLEHDTHFSQNLGALGQQEVCVGPDPSLCHPRGPAKWPQYAHWSLDSTKGGPAQLARDQEWCAPSPIAGPVSASSAGSRSTPARPLCCYPSPAPSERLVPHPTPPDVLPRPPTCSGRSLPDHRDLQAKGVGACGPL